MNYKGHPIKWCENCKCYYIKCEHCGNTSCNGGGCDKCCGEEWPNNISLEFSKHYSMIISEYDQDL